MPSVQSEEDSDASQHSLQKAGGGPSREVSCDICGRKFHCFRNLTAHKRLSHGGRQCQSCGNDYENREALRLRKRHCAAVGLPITAVDQTNFRVKVEQVLKGSLVVVDCEPILKTNPLALTLQMFVEAMYSSVGRHLS